MNLKLLKDIQQNINSNNINDKTFTGQLNDKNIILKIKGIMDNSFNFDKLDNLELVVKNDRFYKYTCTNKIIYEINVIYPALEEDYIKYVYEKKRILETPNMYYNIIYPKIINQDLTWIDNIVNGKNEAESIIYSDNDIVLLPDLKWSSKNIEDMYYLVLFKNKNIRSIRDLNQSHLSLLKTVNHICINKIKEIHNIKENKLRIYFHYHPSFWQLHLHINLIANPFYGALIDFAHLLSTVCNNIELMNDYYQKATIEINTKEN